MNTYTIVWTRLVTETFRVDADTEDEAVDALSGLSFHSEDGIEQIAESTIHSEIEITSAQEL